MIASDYPLIDRFLRQSAIATLLAISALDAQSNTGSVSGVVSNAKTGAFLPGAIVQIVGANLAGETDREGRFRIVSVPAGSQIIRISYLGLNPRDLPVEVPAGSNVFRTVELEPTVLVLGAFLVEATAEPMSRALNQQRTANTIKSIISSDAFGVLPDATAAEALSRLPGISIDRDRGEGSTVTVRGLAPALNNVSLDGQRLPSNDGFDRNGDGRTARLEAVPTELIGQIEVTKAATPDVDADFLGANVNLRTRSPFDFKRAFTTGKAQYKYNDIIEGSGTLFSVSHYQRFGAKDNLGITLSATYEDDHTTVDHAFLSYHDTPLTRNGRTFEVFNTIDLRNREQNRDRTGANGSIEWRANEGRTALVVRGYYNDYVSQEFNRRYRVVFPNPSTVALANRYSANTTEDVAQVTVANSAFRNTIDYQTDRGVGSLALDVRHEGGDYKITGTASWIESRNRRDQFNPQFRWNNVPNLGWDRTDPRNPLITGDVFQYDRYFLFDYSLNEHFSKDTDTVGQIDAEKTRQIAGLPVTFKAGLKFRGKERIVRPTFGTISYSGPQIFLDAFLEDNPNDYYQTGQRLGRLPSVTKVQKHMAANPGQWIAAQTAVDNTLQNEYDASEDITAAYGMMTVDFGKLRLVGGLRMEETKVTVSAKSYDVGSGAYVPSSDTGTYRNLFPALVASYRITERVIMRGAWTSTIARPNYGSMVPFERVNRDLLTITRGNPDLGPAKSMNWDLSLEFYLQPNTLLSVAAFYKDVDDFALTQVYQVDRQYSFLNPASGLTETTTGTFEVSQPANGATLKLRGLEVDLLQRLNFLPGFLSGFSVGGNVTFIRGESVFYSLNAAGDRIPRETNFRPSQSDFIANVNVGYDRGPFSAKVAYNHTGKFPQSIGTTSALDQWVDTNTNLSASVIWRLKRPGWSLFVNGINLGSTGRLLYQGNPDRPLQRETASWSAAAGINFRL